MNAVSHAQNRPREVCSAATESGCRSRNVIETLTWYSFQPKIRHNITALRFGITGGVLYEPNASRTYLIAATYPWTPIPATTACTEGEITDSRLQPSRPCTLDM
jgi:hypothetical protein